MTVSREDRSKALIVATSEGNLPLQIVRWSGQRDSVETTAVSQRMQIPLGCVCIEVTAERDVFVAFGDNVVVANTTIAIDASRLLLAGVQVMPVPLDPATDSEYTHIAVVKKTAGGIFQIEQVI